MIIDAHVNREWLSCLFETERSLGVHPSGSLWSSSPHPSNDSGGYLRGSGSSSSFGPCTLCSQLGGYDMVKGRFERREGSEKMVRDARQVSKTDHHLLVNPGGARLLIRNAGTPNERTDAAPVACINEPAATTSSTAVFMVCNLHLRQALAWSDTDSQHSG